MYTLISGTWLTDYTLPDPGDVREQLVEDSRRWCHHLLTRDNYRHSPSWCNLIIGLCVCVCSEITNPPHDVCVNVSPILHPPSEHLHCFHTWREISK